MNMFVHTVGGVPYHSFYIFLLNAHFMIRHAVPCILASCATSLGDDHCRMLDVLSFLRSIGLARSFLTDTGLCRLNVRTFCATEMCVLFY